MGYGFQVLNDSGTVQIDQDYTNSRLVLTGSCSSRSGALTAPAPHADVQLELPAVINLDVEIPIILMRPSALGVYVGGVQFWRNYAIDPGTGMPTIPTGTWTLWMSGSNAFDYAIFSSLGTPVTDSATHGLEVYRADGSVAYTSRHSHPRITDVLAYPAATYGYPYSFGFPSKPAMPWLLANPLCSSYLGVGDTSEYVGGIYMRLDSLSSCTVDLLELGAGSQIHGIAPNYLEYNPYSGIPARFGLCNYA